MPVVVMASGTGSLMAAVLDLAATEDAPFRVVGVVVDRDCGAADRAVDADLPVILCELREYPDREAWDAALTASVAELAPEWVVTAGFMKILGPAFLDRFGGRILNSHPALLPAFPGAHGVADALAYGVKVTGTTVHLVDDGVDTGPILAQRIVEVLPDDSEETLHERIKEVERVLLPEVVHAVVTRGVVTDGRKAHIK
ncbi:phosphoribosylglycinamide formyltransferase [Gordonia sp. QH-12]|nr:phosphoribosylglycinamide formyltransferase [Gordonia sihwensis]KXT56505.1 phosphoribosylglycinamide formyltransferase [Gordonia sp. QH-12]